MSEATDSEVGGWRATRTRDAIVAASQQLFLDRGYAGTRINNITDACGISRAGFYTYFKDKRAVFNHIGEATYHDLVAVIGQWERLPDPLDDAELRVWVQSYFTFLDDHGAFILSSTQSAPTDEAFRKLARRMQMRVGRLLGTAMTKRQHTPSPHPETLGLAMIGMLERGWYHSRVQRLAFEDSAMIETMTQVLLGALRNG